MTNFRGVTTELDFRESQDKVASRVRLSGENGARKTTVREAIAFAFTGRDSTGAANPTHLISMGEGSCEIEVQTRKGAVIRRTLSKRSGALRLTLPGQGTVEYSQTKFEEMLTPADVFLSVLVPGYLLSAMNKARQAAVLSYILPPVDRPAYMLSSVREAIGAPSASIMELDYSRRPDLVQKQVAETRIAEQNEMAECRGRLKTLQESQARTPKKPEMPPEVALFDLQENLHRDWLEYEAMLSAYSRQVKELQLKREDNARIHKSRGFAQIELDSLHEVPLPAPPPKFELPQPVAPPAPAFQNEEQRDRCPQCGQTVGLKHREMVRAQNASIEEAYETQHRAFLELYNEWKAAKNASDHEHRVYAEKVREIVSANQKVSLRRRELQQDLDRKFTPHSLPPEDPLPPKKPAEEFSRERYLEIKAITQGYYRELGAYDSYVRGNEGTAQKISELEGQLQGHEARIEWYKAHEEALRLLPGYELMQQKAHLEMPQGYRINTEDGVQLFDRTGCPYDLLSRGQKMRADFEICLKVNSLLQRKVGMVFLDDFDLADWAGLLDEASPNIQIFTAHVEKGQALSVGLGKPT